MQNLQALGLVTVCTCLSVGYGCQDGSLPSPTAIASPTATDTQPGRQSVRGRVTDPEERPIAGVTIEVLQGAEPQLRTMTNAEGKFELTTSTASGNVILRASRDGFVPRIVDTSWRTSGDREYELPIWLDTGPGIDLQPGAYMLTISFNLNRARPWSSPNAPACTGFPSELASRSYRVEVGPATWTPDPDDRLVRIENAPFPFGGRFLLSIVGRYITLGEMDDSLVEELPGIRFVTFSGGGRPAATATVSGRSVSFPLTAGFSYCQLKYPLGHYHDCSQIPADGIVDYRACISDEAKMTFAPR